MPQQGQSASDHLLLATVRILKLHAARHSRAFRLFAHVCQRSNHNRRRQHLQVSPVDLTDISTERLPTRRHQNQGASSSASLVDATSDAEDHANSEERLDDDIPRKENERPPLITDEAAWRIGIREIQRAVKMAGASAPGPDGIPYIARKVSGNQALQVLLDAALALQSDAPPMR